MPERKTPNDHRNRMIVLALFITFSFSVIIAQLVKYQVVRHAELKALAEAQRFRTRNVSPPRGVIYDINGIILAMNTVQWDISVSPRLVSNPAKLAPQLAEILQMEQAQVHETLVAAVPWIRLRRFVPHQIGESVRSLDANGISCDPIPQRIYPNGGLFAHIVGIVTTVGDGFYGIEGYHNQLLKGRAGHELIELDPRGSPLPIPPEDQKAPQLGTSLVLTVDSNIQYIVTQELQRAFELYGAKSGTIIVMDPQTGAILANISLPGYDPNARENTDLKMLADPAVSSMWEPGSIFKIITWSAGIDTGTISPGTTFYDDGSMEVGGWAIRNWNRRENGLVTMTDGLVKSLNTVAAYISTSIGKEQFYLYLRRFGFGSITEVDLDSEGPGMMKLPGDSDWFPSELGTNSFGQGIAVTPIQMITAAAAVANRGLLMKPHVVHQYLKDDGEGNQRIIQVEPVIARRAISEETARTMVHMLVEVVESGATLAQVPGYTIAGKTGTAEVPTPVGYRREDTIASFIGFAPADSPQFIVLVKLDKPQTSPWGSQTAAPTFRAIAERLFIYMHIPPDDIRLAQAP